jgi:predicted lipoprotein with Yx(FWY)xxD motif
MDQGRRSKGRGTAKVAQGALMAAVLAGGLGTALTAPAGASASRTVTVETAQVPKVGLVLTTSTGRTLYRFTSDPKGTSTCTGECAKVWPPLLLPKGDHLKGAHGLKGLSTIHVAHGRLQVAFDGVALYRFTGDTKAGQAKGQGVEGSWFAVLKSGIPAAAHVSTTTAPPATTTPTTTPAASPGSAPVTTPTTPTMATVPSPPVTQPTEPAPPPPPPTTTPTTAPPTGGAGF